MENNKESENHCKQNRFEKWFENFKNRVKTDTLFYLLVNTFVYLTLAFFSPLEVFAGNINEFWFSFSSIWYILLLAALGLTVATTLIELILPKKLSTVINLLAFSGGLCCYIQSMVLNGQMGSLTGESDIYSKKTLLLNLMIWGFIFVAVLASHYILKRYKKKDTVKTVAKFLSAALVLMQSTAMISTILSGQVKTLEPVNYLTIEGEFELAKDKNVIVFIVDTCDASFYEQALEKYPDMIDGYDGFTYYDNATSTYSRTYPSLPYLLTGVDCRYDIPYDEYIENAHQNSTYIKDISANDRNVGIYTNMQYVGNASADYVNNSAPFKNDVKTVGLLKQMAKISLYRNAPYLIKSRFSYTTQSVNENTVFLPDLAIQQKDLAYYAYLKETGIKINESYNNGTFRLYHMWGSHPGAEFDENLNPVDEYDTLKAVAGNFKIIGEYIKQLKQLGLYQSTEIIITADHGTSVGTSDANPLVIPGPARITLLAKPAGVGNNTEVTEDDTPYTISSAPVCHKDLFATIIAAVGGDTEKYGKTIYHYSEGEQRKRYYYNTAMYSDEDGEVALREYLIDGHAKDFENWRLTGNNWDIDYSERAVSRHRLSELDQ